MENNKTFHWNKGFPSSAFAVLRKHILCWLSENFRNCTFSVLLIKVQKLQSEKLLKSKHDAWQIRQATLISKKTVKGIACLIWTCCAVNATLSSFWNYCEVELPRKGFDYWNVKYFELWNKMYYKILGHMLLSVRTSCFCTGSLNYCSSIY